MGFLEIFAMLITVTAVFSYINHRWIGLPVTIGVMLMAMLMSLAILLIDLFGFHLEQQATELLHKIDFNQTLLHGMLSFLLFAGALHININDLAEQKWTISTLATVGTLVSTFLVGTATWWILQLMGMDLSYLFCLVFGALISPTDPIAVLGILKDARAPKSLETKIVGESLFNDGVGVVVFLVILGIAMGSTDLSAGHVGLLFVQETVGGALFGLGVGYLAYCMLSSIDQHQVEVLITLALVAGGYALANALHLSGPIAIVVAGLLIGNQGRLLGMSEKSRQHLDTFWELIDEVLNAILFVLIGLEVLVLAFTNQYLFAGLLLIPVVLLSRLVAIGIPVSLLQHFQPFGRGAVWIMTWGGLRGGISVALALSLPPGPEREIILAVTYLVVVFSILVQGLTMGKLVRWVMAGQSEPTPM